MSRSLSRPRRAQTQPARNSRRRASTTSFEDTEIIKRIETAYEQPNSAPAFRNTYDRLAAKAFKYQFLHKVNPRRVFKMKFIFSWMTILSKITKIHFSSSFRNFKDSEMSPLAHTALLDISLSHRLRGSSEEGLYHLLRLLTCCTTPQGPGEGERVSALCNFGVHLSWRRMGISIYSLRQK